MESLASVDNCPECGVVLYPIASMRPAAGMSLAAKALFTLGCAAWAFIYLFGVILIPSFLFAPFILVMVLWFPVAFLPALALGWFARSLPPVLRLRCRKCRWTAQSELGAPR